MPNMISRQQAEALIQEQLINTIQQDAPKQSVFMGDIFMGNGIVSCKHIIF